MTQNLPPGDGGISCGQLVWGELNMDMTGPETFAKGEPD